MIGLGLSIVQLAVRQSVDFARGSSLALDFTSGNQTLDPRITFTRASSATRFDSTGTLVTMGNNEARFDYDPVTLQPRGLLIEEQRTNSIRNPTMQGAVAGTPGTLPTNWISQSIGGVALTSIVSVGNENGIPYVDVRYTGTTSSTAAGAILTEGTTQISAVLGQTWASSFYVKLVAGSLSGINVVDSAIQERSSGGSLLAATNTQITPTSADLSGQRISITRTLNNASTAFVGQGVRFTPASGVAIDFTLRIGLPQLELGASASSPILSSGAATTRAADVAVMTGANFSSWYNQAEGTLYSEASVLALTTDAITVSVNNGTSANDMRLRSLSSGSSSAFRVFNEGVNQASLVTASAISANVVFKQAGAYRIDDFAFVPNGGTVLTDTSGTVPSSVNQLTLGNLGSGVSMLNGHIRRIAYFPRRLANSELQAITA
jgi:hypothetical protein